MALLATNRRLGSSLWILRKQLGVGAISLHRTPQLASVQNSSGIRCCSHPAQTDSEHVGEYVRKTQGSRNVRKSLKFQKKLHNRVFSDQEIADNQKFRSQKFVSETETETFGTFQTRQENRKSIDYAPLSALKSNVQNDVSDGLPEGERDSTEQSAPKPANTVFTQRVKPRKQRQSWCDEFGTLAEDSISDRIEESLTSAIGSHEERFSDDEDEQETMRIRLSAVGRRHIPEWYGRRILKLGKRGQVREAIEVLEEWMLKQDRVMPNSYVFTCLLTVLGRAGYTKKAFSLFRKMKSMGLKPKPATYTALFNACANSPWKEDGQARADGLVRLMEEKEVEPTFITGKAMVKAFALCGDLRRAFSLVDELSRVYRPDPEVFSFLLMACISDREAGLRHAIQVWRLMQQMDVRPDLPLYNLLLRCVRDCGVGDISSFTSMLTGNAHTSHLDAGSDQQRTLLPADAREDYGAALDLKDMAKVEAIRSGSVHLEQVSPQSEPPSLEGHGIKSENDSQVQSLELREETQVKSRRDVQSVQSQSTVALHSPVTVPDVLSPNRHDSRIVSLSSLSAKEDRLSLLGGAEGLLSRMAKDGVAPNLITFTQLISVSTPTVEAEQQLLDVMRSMGVKPDVDLVNALIHKRCMRADFFAAKATRDMLVEYGLTANQMTYGVLAMTCKSQKEAVQLLKDMEAADMVPNMEILGTLMYASGTRFGYKLWVLRQVQHLDLSPNDKFLRNVETTLNWVRRKMVQAERQGQIDSYYLSPFFQQSLETFTEHYESWLKQTQMQTPRHPWATFRPPSSHLSDAAST